MLLSVAFSLFSVVLTGHSTLKPPRDLFPRCGDPQSTMAKHHKHTVRESLHIIQVKIKPVDDGIHVPRGDDLKLQHRVPACGRRGMVVKSASCVQYAVGQSGWDARVELYAVGEFQSYCMSSRGSLKELHLLNSSSPAWEPPFSKRPLKACAYLTRPLFSPSKKNSAALAGRVSTR